MRQSYHPLRGKTQGTSTLLEVRFFRGNAKQSQPSQWTDNQAGDYRLASTRYGAHG
jgi:hypothetical protein